MLFRWSALLWNYSHFNLSYWCFKMQETNRSKIRQKGQISILRFEITVKIRQIYTWMGSYVYRILISRLWKIWILWDVQGFIYWSCGVWASCKIQKHNLSLFCSICRIFCRFISLSLWSNQNINLNKFGKVPT